MHCCSIPCMYCGYLMCAIVLLAQPLAALDCQASVKRIGPSLKTTLVCGGVALYNQTTPIALATEVHFHNYGIKIFGRFPREEGIDHGVGVLVFQGVSLSLFDSNFESLPAELPGGAVLAPIIVNDSVVSISNTTIQNQQVALTAGGVFITGRSAVTLHNCWFEGNFAAASGALAVREQSHVEARQCVFDRNSAVGYAGAIHLHGGSTLVVEDSSFLGVREHLPVADIFELRALVVGKYATHELKSFQGNLVSVAGAILVTEGSAARVSNSTMSGYGGQRGTVHVSGKGSSVKLIKSRFMDNFLWGGAGVYVEGSLAEVDSCWFERNMAKIGGGILVAGGGVLRVAGCHFEHNRALSRGGAVFVDGPSGEVRTSESVVRIAGSTFYENEAKSGGGLYAMYSRLDVVGCQLEGNRAQSNGGGLFMFLAGSSTFAESFFQGNEAQYGGGIYVEKGELVSFVGISFVGNKASGGTGGGAHLTGVENVQVSTSAFMFNLASESGGALSLSHVGTTNIFGAQFNFNEATLAGGSLAASRTQGINVGNSSFHDNIAKQCGGAVELQDVQRVVLNSSNFVHNMALGADGGALHITSGLDIKVWNCSFTDNSAFHAGGAAMVEEVGNICVQWSNLSSNSASEADGGALHLHGVGIIALEDSRLDGNQAAASGGGIRMEQQHDIIVNKTVFASNSATTGGALAASSSKRITMTGSKFEGCSAVFVGGAVDLIDLENVQVGNTVFAQNAVVCTGECQGGSTVSATGIGRGGALHAALVDDLNFQNCSFENNSASISGGAVVSQQVLSMGLESVNFIRNTCGQAGGAVNFDSTVEVNVTGGVMEENMADYGGGFLLQGNTTLQGSNVKFLSNSATSSGGALACTGNASIVFNTSDFENDVGHDVNSPLVNCSCDMTFLNCSFVDEELTAVLQDGGGTCSIITDNCTFVTPSPHNFTGFFFWGKLGAIGILQGIGIMLFFFFLLLPLCMTLTRLKGFATVEPKWSKKEADSGSDLGGLADPGYFDALTRPLLEAPFVPYQPSEISSRESAEGEERSGNSVDGRLRPVMPLFPFVPKLSSSEASNSSVGQDCRSSSGSPWLLEHEQALALDSQNDECNGDAGTPPLSHRHLGNLKNKKTRVSCLSLSETESCLSDRAGCLGVDTAQLAGGWRASLTREESYRATTIGEANGPGEGSYGSPCINQLCMDTVGADCPLSNPGLSTSGQIDSFAAGRDNAEALPGGEPYASSAGSSNGRGVDRLPNGLQYHPVGSPATSASAHSDSLLGSSPPLLDSWQLEDTREGCHVQLPYATTASNTFSSSAPLARAHTHRTEMGVQAPNTQHDTNGGNVRAPARAAIRGPSSAVLRTTRSLSGQGRTSGLEGVHPQEVGSLEWQRVQQMRPSNESEGGVGQQAAQGLSIRDERRCRMQLVLSFGFFNVTLEV
ncbi:unnamed protein product [Ostreobium quekettii]|uniref:Right handed beta helix domain-containing protein n=1 Tax=Ostreobium quekettii TaxID=121088 RepID=A0A8S1J2F7_9CHLO|nr:unnamed protein product [Ostreobium quekettii]|eukprot:evm.model.scf_3588.1 EVM.evm.TU.scf_3588.1   scf_3588:960-5249(-)